LAIWEWMNNIKNWEKWKQSANLLQKWNYSQYLKEALKVETNLNNIYKNQKRLLSGWFNQYLSLGKIKSIPSFLRLERNSENLKIEINAKELPSKLNSVKQFAKEFPEFIGTLPQAGFTLVIVGQNVFWEWEFKKEKLINDLSYLVPIFWPGKVIFSASTMLDENWEIQYKNIALASSMIIFWTADIITVWQKLIGSWWVLKWIWKAWKYIASPITAPIKTIWEWTKITRIWYDIFKQKWIKEVINAWWKWVWQWIKKLWENLTKWSWWFKFAWLALLAAYWAMEYLDENTKEELIKKWYIIENEDWGFELNIDKIKSWTNEERKKLLNEVILAELSWLEWISINIKNNKIIIERDTNKNKNLKYISNLSLKKYDLVLKNIYDINIYSDIEIIDKKY
jgi:hypothetical protein